MGWLAMCFAAFCAAVLGQLVLLRLGVVGNSVVAFVGFGAVVGIALMTVLFHFYPFDIALSGTLLYAFICELHTFLFTFAFSSVSANLLVRFGIAPMNRAEIDDLYDDRCMIQDRIAGLRGIALITVVDGRIAPTANGRALAFLFNAARAFFMHH